MSAMRFTRDHEWVRMEDTDVGVVGITDHAQEQLGDLVHAELPEPGRDLGRGDEAAVVESVKAAGEIHSPLAGTVTEVNTALVDDPGLANQDPLGAGWFFKLRLADPDEFSALMDEAAYREYLDS